VKHHLRLILFVLSALVLSVVAGSVVAQEAAEGTLGAGEGAPIVEPNFGGDISTLNPILVADGPSQDVVDRLFPILIGADPDTGLPVKGGLGAMATDWTVSDDGMVYTFTLRDDWKWSDGTPVTAADMKYTFDAATSGEVDSRITAAITNIASVEAPDASTVVVTFKTADCEALGTTKYLVFVPSHKYTEVYPAWTDMTPDSDYNLNPTVTGGDFTFANFRAGEQVTLLANQDYPDAQLGYVVPEGWVFKQVADQLVGVEQFLAGNVTLIDSVPDDKADELQQMGNSGELVYKEAPSASWHYLIFNVADPKNPQSGQDADGNLIDQGHHPLFGDVRVRQALALSIDHEALNAGAFNGRGSPIGSFVLPASWGYNDAVAPWPYDPQQAAALLDEAGFVDDDDDPTTPRVANDDALYAEPGTPLAFDFTTFSGNPTMEATAVLVQDQLSRTGFKMNLDIIEFQSMIGKLLAQTFDTAGLFIGPFDVNNPGEAFELLDASGDIIDSGLNAGSYHNPEVTTLLEEARSLPGCDPAARKALYDQAQVIVRDELPVYFFTNSRVPYVAQADLLNYDPRARSLRWNITMWSQNPR
jgi:peptide/nickel transport system substrate-binding protein